VAGTPVNMPTHAHTQGYSDINFLIPELVAGVQFSKGRYFAEQSDFATAGASNINYVTALDRPIVHIDMGTYGFARALVAASPRLGPGHLLAAFESSTNDGPWTVPDSYHKLNALVRYSQGNAVNGFSLTAMGYHGDWNATEAVPQRAVDAGLVPRFGSIDPTDGGHTYRYSVAADWQRGDAAKVTRVTAFGLAYDLDLVSNFTFFLDDPVHGDQIEQADHRFVSGVKASQRRVAKWAGRPVQNTFGVQLRNDDIGTVAVYRTEKRVRIGTRSQASVLETTGGAYAENNIEWAPWLRTTLGLRADVSRFRVDDRLDSANSGTTSAGLVSPKASVSIGPWNGTEFYANVGSIRLRYFGPRPLVDDGSVESKATMLVNLEGGYQLRKGIRATLEVFNVFNAAVSDIDYYFASRLPGEPLQGVNDIHFHPAVPRTARLSLIFSF